VVTLNLEQDHKRWHERRPLVLEGLRTLKPDIIALNEVSVTQQSARGLQKDLASLPGVNHNLVQQTKVNSRAPVEVSARVAYWHIASLVRAAPNSSIYAYAP
jgi:predicted RNase H-like nuclease (RuvC/YqgF family)